MSKTCIIVLLVIGAAGGYLTYDWYGKTNPDVEDQFTYLHSWTDAQGQTHFSDSPPPPDAQNIRKVRTRKSLDEPWVTQITAFFSGIGRKTKKTFASWTGANPEPAVAATPDYSNYDDEQLKKSSGVKRRWEPKKTRKS